jgi:hypothetical protein
MNVFVICLKEMLIVKQKVLRSSQVADVFQFALSNLSGRTEIIYIQAMLINNAASFLDE